MAAPLLLVVLVGATVRAMLYRSSLASFICERVEVVSPQNSWKRVVEGLALLDLEVSPYSGDLFHELPLHFQASYLKEIRTAYQKDGYLRTLTSFHSKFHNVFHFNLETPLMIYLFHFLIDYAELVFMITDTLTAVALYLAVQHYNKLLFKKQKLNLELKEYASDVVELIRTPSEMFLIPLKVALWKIQNAFTELQNRKK